jgi:hypothetical protein
VANNAERSKEGSLMPTLSTHAIIAAEMRKALEEQRIVSPQAMNDYCIVTVGELTKWADALEAAHQETSTETALQCPICHGTGTLSPDDSERVIQSSGELFNAGYDAGKRAALKESPSGD